MDWTAAVVIPTIFIGLPWMIMHYVTKWKTAGTITRDDEELLEELYDLAKRLDERMDTVERLTANDDSSFKAPRILHGQDADHQKLRELDRMLAEKKGTRT